ncbi:ArsR/SmtB family transcription factor, partial [Rhodococcus chondri]|nr:transcriptional regulator [Rhodococcus sp. CC-R104]
SQHLKVLRDAGFVRVHKDGTRRLYRLDPAPLTALEDWMAGLRPLPAPALDALGTEIARGKRERRRRTATTDEKHRRSS